VNLCEETQKEKEKEETWYPSNPGPIVGGRSTTGHKPRGVDKASLLTTAPAASVASKQATQQQQQ
jgi:hypothetical protein